MKKIIIGAFALLVCLATNAASTKWSVTVGASNATLANSTSSIANLSGYSCYLIETATWNSAVATQNGVTAAVLNQAITSSAWTSVDTSYDTDPTEGKYSFKVATAEYAANQNFDAGDYSVYLVITDGTKYALGSAQDLTVFTSDTATDPNNAMPQWKFTNSAAIQDSALQTFAVPEPTSGLLVLIGLAGLALKRKKA